MTKRKWAIAWYQAGQLPGHNYIESSIGYPYLELTSIAKRMNRNGEGSRYKVVRYVPPDELTLRYWAEHAK
jgi:hypothetical protein